MLDISSPAERGIDKELMSFVIVEKCCVSRNIGTSKIRRRIIARGQGLIMANREIRDVAELLVGSLSGDYGSSHSRNIVNSVNLIAEDLAQGHRVNGRMSSVRRFFCLLVTFDLLFTSLLWLICIVMPGGNLRDIFMLEVIQYNVKRSLVDIVAMAAGRFLILLIFYALLYIHNWSVVAFTTAFTCGFLIAKVFCYDWPSAKEPVYHVFLILTSFVLAWGEAWFLDTRVFPQEQKSANIIGAITAGDRGTYSERTPLLTARAQTCAESTCDFFSPLNSQSGSPRARGSPEQYDLMLTCERIDEYQRLAQDAIGRSWKLLHSGGWNRERRGDVKGDVVEMLNISQYEKVFRFRGSLDCPAKWLLEDLRENYATIAEWNPTIKKARTIKKLTEGTDLVYQVSEGAGKGLISERDFVLLRRLCALDSSGRTLDDSEPSPEYYVVGVVSVDVPELPPVKDYCRGIIKVSSWYLSPIVHKTSSGKMEEKCHYQWLFSLDLKGKMPAFVVDPVLSKVMLSNVGYLRKHIEDARRKKLF